MKRESLLLLLLYLSFATSQHFDKTQLERKSTNSTCFSDSNCSNRGQCLDGSCLCDTFYSGDTCKDKWSDNSSWSIGFIIYGCYAAILQLLCTIYALHDLFITVRYFNEGGWSKWTLTTYIHILGVVAGIFRVVVFAIDPHSARGILPPVVEVLLFNIPVLMWLCAGFMILLYWVELQSTTGIKNLVFITKLRPAFIVLVIASVIILFPIIFWMAITNQPLAFTVYNALMGLVCLILVVALTTIGINLIRVLRTIFNSLSHKRMDKFLKKLLIYIMILDGLLVSLAVTLAVFTIVQAKRHPTAYLTLHWILRTEEFAIIMTTLIFTRKKEASKKPPFQTSESSVVRQSSILNSIHLVSSSENPNTQSDQVPAIEMASSM